MRMISGAKLPSFQNGKALSGAVSQDVGSEQDAAYQSSRGLGPLGRRAVREAGSLEELYPELHKCQDRSLWAFE